MSALYDHISPHSETALRKTLRVSLEEQFGGITSHINALCEKMYAEEVNRYYCKTEYEHINRILDDTKRTFARYADSRRRAVGMDIDGDISFMRTLLSKYTQNINQLKHGLEEAIRHERYFNLYKPETKNRITSLELFLSLNGDVEDRLQALQRQYDELEQELYGPQDDKEVLNRFNRQFYDVAQSHESAWQKALSESIPANVTGSLFGGDSLAERVFMHIASPKKNLQAIHHDQIELTNRLRNYIAGELTSLYTNPQALAREINTRQLVNEVVETVMADLYAWQRLDDLKNAPSESHIVKCQRGRPPEDRFYEGVMDLEKLEKFMCEDFQELYHAPIKEDVQKGGKNSLYFLCAMLVAVNLSCANRVRGRVSCFYRFLQRIFGKMGRTLRYFQKYIDGFIKFLWPTETTTESIFAKPKLKEKKFRIGHKLLCRITYKLALLRLQPIFT